MKKLLLSLLCAAASLTAAAADETQTLIFDFTPNTNLQGFPNTNVTSKKTVTYDNVDFTFWNSWWQKNTSNSYIATKKNVEGAYMEFGPIPNKNITSITLYLPTGITTNSKFDLFCGDNTTATGQFTWSIAGTNSNTITIPTESQTGTFKIQTANTKNQCGFGKIILEYTEDTGKTPSQLAFDKTDWSVEEGTSTFTDAPIFANPLGIDVTYTSSDETVARFDGTTFTIGKPGEATITASPVDTETYEGDATLTLTVTEKSVITLGAITVNGKEVADEEVVNVDLNSDVVFAAENAEMISYTIAGNNDFSETDTGEATLTWKATAAGEFIAEVEALLGEDSKTIMFTLNVTAPKQDVTIFEWSKTSVTITEGEEFTAPTFTSDPVDLAVAFTSDNESVATVDAQGTITLAGAPGTAVITATFNGNDTYNSATATTTITVKPTTVEPTGLWKRVMSLNDINDYTAYMLAGYNDSKYTWHALTGEYGNNFKTGVVTSYEDLLESDETINGEINIIKSGDYYNFYMINAVVGDNVGGYITCNSSSFYNSNTNKTNNKNYATVVAEKATNGASNLSLTMDANQAVKAVFSASTEDSSTSHSPILTFSFNSSASLFSCYNGSQKAFYIYEPVTEAIEGVLTENGEPVSYDEAINLKLNEPRTLHITLAPKHTGYWKFVEGNNTKEVKALAAEHTPAEGYNQYVHENGITLTEAGTLYHYTHFNGKVTAEKALTVTGSTTGITEVEAGVSGVAEWFDLTGRRVAKPAKGGVYILKEGSKTSKRAF